MDTSNQSETPSVIVTDLYNDKYWTSKTGFYFLWYVYLAFSPSYELARRDVAGELTKKERTDLPEEFNRVLEVYADFGDVRSRSFLDWWREKGMSLCAFENREPSVIRVDILQHFENKRPNPSPTLDKYIDGRWADEGHQNTILVAIPVGLPKKKITDAINFIVGHQPKWVKKIENSSPTYSLSGKRQSKKMLLRYMSVLQARALIPDTALWRIGAEYKVSKKHSPKLDPYAKLSRKELDTDRMILASLTSRALKRGALISENAARGVFPSYANNPYALRPNLIEIRKTILSGQFPKFQ